jgi:hypothetical protein
MTNIFPLCSSHDEADHVAYQQLLSAEIKTLNKLFSKVAFFGLLPTVSREAINREK